MSASIIDGKAIAQHIHNNIAASVQKLKQRHGIIPGLAVILIGEDPASNIYVRNKKRQTFEVGMHSVSHHFDACMSEKELLDLIKTLNNDPKIHGILVQLPVPDHISDDKVINAIKPEKDVDGFHILNVGKLNTGQKSMISCTPLGCMILARTKHEDLSGKHAVVIGRSNIVGKPVAQLLLKANCTLSIAHSRTQNIAQLTRQADILVAAAGRPEMVKGDWIKPGATVIDVGVNRIAVPELGEGKTKLVGDVDFDQALKIAGSITPVPGGVGPMTIACLLTNTLVAAMRIHDIELDDWLLKFGL